MHERRIKIGKAAVGTLWLAACFIFGYFLVQLITDSF
ncbi:hypothetical protein RKD49_005404 [Streptomyces glaucescens]|jgi:hypothetical protein